MTSINTELSARFAKSYTTAAFGYARAASAAYAALADQALDFWSRAAKQGLAQADAFADRSTEFKTGPQPYRSAYSPSARHEPAVPNPFAITDAWVSSPMMAPVRAWWGMFPLEGNPASWPMAYAMMSAGVPRTVAFPTAEANVAAMDAADAASASLNQAWSTYRSDNGFAVAQVLVASSKTLTNALMLTPLAPLAMTVKLPWAA